MRRYSLISLFALLFACGGCQLITTHVTNPIKQSLRTAAEDYHQVTTGSDSRYIQSQGREL
jgi:hypothetical protein